MDSQERKTKVDAWMEKVLKPMREGLLALPDGPVKDVGRWCVLPPTELHGITAITFHNKHY